MAKRDYYEVLGVARGASEEEIKKAEALAASKEPNRGIMDHERKRKLEVKCMELEELLREQVAIENVF